MASVSQDVREALGRESDETWVKVTKRLTGYAVYILRCRRWRGGHGGTPPDGFDAEAIALEAIERLLSSNNWRPDVYSIQAVEIELKRIVKNLVRNLGRRKENVLVSNEGDLRAGDEECRNEDFFQNFPDASSQPDNVVQQAEAVRQLERFQSEFKLFTNGDDQVQHVFNCICDGVLKRDDQAQLLQITPREVTNIRKRLDRKLDQFAQKFPKYPNIFIEELKNA